MKGSKTLVICATWRVYALVVISQHSADPPAINIRMIVQHYVVTPADLYNGLNIFSAGTNEIMKRVISKNLLE